MADKKKNDNDGYYHKDNKNYTVLVEADKIGWHTAKKTKGITARKLEKDVIVITIEGKTKGSKGDWFCIGAGNEYWVQKESSLMKKYDPKQRIKKPIEVDYEHNGKKVEYTDFIEFKPKPDRAVLACKMKKEFIVHASWGTLKGKKHDYIVKPKEDGLNPNPQDVWIVDKDLFEVTYSISFFRA